MKPAPRDVQVLRHDSDASCFCSLKPRYNEDCHVGYPPEPLVEVALIFFTVDDDKSPSVGVSM